MRRVEFTWLPLLHHLGLQGRLPLMAHLEYTPGMIFLHQQITYCKWIHLASLLAKFPSAFGHCCKQSPGLSGMAQ